MAVLVYPPLLLSFTSLMWQIGLVSRSGGPSLLGTEQIVSSPAGRWMATITPQVGTMAWNGSEELLAYRGLMARLRGRANVVALPYFDGRGPAQLLGLPSVEAELAAAASMNAVQIVLTYPSGVAPLPGQAFSIEATDGGSWLHQIAAVVDQDGDDYTVLISPWLREDYAAGIAVEVDNPTSRMRLVTDLSGALTIQAGQAWANPTLEFVEAF